MNAKTARDEAVRIAAQREQARKERNLKAAADARKKEEEELRKFEEDLLLSAHRDIEYAVKEGKTKTSVYLASSGTMYENYPDWFLQNHRFAPGTKRVMKKLEKEGFKCELGWETETHSTQHESMVPDYNYYTYSTVLKISW